MEYILETHNLGKRYKDFKALSDLNMHIEKGSIYGLIGKNGAGKTTLIRLICGLQKPTSGSYSIYGVSNLNKKIIDVRKRIGAIVETPSIYLDLTARENLKEQYKIVGLPSYDGLDEILELVGLSKTGNKKAKNFSLGMRQRLGIAEAIINNPELLILDEPTNGLDIEGTIEMRNLIQNLSHQGIAILISSHNLTEINNLCNRIITIKNGKIITNDTIEEFKTFAENEKLSLEEAFIKKVGENKID